jgi:hypothetical protein
MLSQRSSTFSSGKQKLWPDPKDSTGVLLATLGRNKCVWEAIGPARVAFNVLQNTIAEYLDQICEPLSGDVVWSLYMVGRTRETASPSITFSSREPGPRQKVKAHIKQSTILEDYPGFITMDIDRPPGCRNSVVTTLGELDGTKGYSPTIYGEEVSVTVGRENFMGTCIYLPGTPDIVATGGGLLRFKDKFFMSSVAHPFEKHWNNRFPEETPPPRHYIFNIDDMSDDDDDEGNDMVEKTSGGSVTSNSTLYNTSEYSLSVDNCSLPNTPRLQEEPAATTDPILRSSADLTAMLGSSHLETVNSQLFHNNEGTTIGSQETRVGAAMKAEPPPTASQSPLNTTIHGPAVSSARGGTIGLDYAMFEVPSSILHGQNSNVKQRRSISTPREPRSTEVIVYTPSGPVAGRTLATASFLQPTDGMLPQQLWTVIMEGTLYKGLCGSWVVDPATGEVFGHIIAGAPEDGLAYLVPFYEVIEDLNHHFGDGWELLGSEKTFENISHEVTPPENCTSISQTTASSPKIFASAFSDSATEVSEQGENCKPIGYERSVSPVDDFKSWLKAKSVTTAVDKATVVPTEKLRTFLPANRLQQYFSKTEKADNLKTLLETASKNLAEEFDVELVRNSFQKIFAILILVDRGPMIANFLGEGISDSHLPFVRGHEETPIEVKFGQSFYETFCEAQWQFCSPSLHHGMDENYDERAILPFISKDEIHEGDSAKIYQIKVHSEYNRLSQPYQPKVCSRLFASTLMYTR